MSSGPLKVIFFGDSICFGQYVSVHRGWVTRISAGLAEIGKAHGREILVVNASVSGDTTRMALERMPYHVQSHKPDVMLVQFGMNDCNYWASDGGNPRVSPAAFQANLQEILARGYSFGAKTIFLNTNHPTGRTVTPMLERACTYEESNRRYNDIIRSVPGSVGGPTVILNDVGARFRSIQANEPAALERLLLPDQLHLSEDGHDVYFDLIYPSLEQTVRALLGA